MSFAEFLPFAWPPAPDPFVLFGVLLLVGLMFGELARRVRLPTITGYLVIGFLLGPSVSGLLDAALLVAAKPLTHVALALVLFQIGRLLDVRAMARDQGLIATALAEGAASFLLVFVVLSQVLGMDPLPSALVAAIGVSSSPAVLFVVANELGAKGPLTERAFNLVAINNVVAFLLFTALLPGLLEGRGAEGASDAVLVATWQLLGALLLGWALTHLKLLLARWVGRGEPEQFALSLGTIVFALGAANLFGLSILLALLALGILSRNLDRGGALTDVQFGHLASVFFVILFVVSGANLHASELATAGGAALAFAAARIAGKWLGAFAATRLTGGDPQHALLVGLPLVPMASLAIGLVDVTAGLDPRIGATLGAVVLGAIAIFETVGPIATGFALKRAGEVAADAKVGH